MSGLVGRLLQRARGQADAVPVRQRFGPTPGDAMGEEAPLEVVGERIVGAQTPRPPPPLVAPSRGDAPVVDPVSIRAAAPPERIPPKATFASVATFTPVLAAQVSPALPTETIRTAPLARPEPISAPPQSPPDPGPPLAPARARPASAVAPPRAEPAPRATAAPVPATVVARSSPVPAPVVRVTIGRIEVRAPPAPVVAPRPAVQPRVAPVGLDQYLASHRGGRR